MAGERRIAPTGEESCPGQAAAPPQHYCILAPGHAGDCWDGQCEYFHPDSGRRCIVCARLATNDHQGDHEFGDGGRVARA